MYARILGLAVLCLGGLLGTLEPTVATAQQVSSPQYSGVYPPYPNPSYYPWAYGMYGGFGASYMPMYTYPTFSYPAVAWGLTVLMFTAACRATAVALALGMVAASGAGYGGGFGGGF